MAQENVAHQKLRVGWIGTGRMGLVLAERLVNAGVDLWAYNRTPAKAAPLADRGVEVVGSPRELAERDLVFTMVAGAADVREVTLGEAGVLSGETRPAVLVDASTIDLATAAELREQAAALGTAVVAAPVSGNPKVAGAGRLTCVASGPVAAYERALPYLELFGRKVSYVGEADEARLVKICHNLLLGAVAESMAEITLLAEAGGVARADFLEFLNESVMGSVFTRYKTPALVGLDFTPTFTWHLLRKDLELGLEAGNDLGVPLPVSDLVHQLVVDGIDRGFGDLDFAALITRLADDAGRRLAAESRSIDDGLTPTS